MRIPSHLPESEKGVVKRGGGLESKKMPDASSGAQSVATLPTAPDSSVLLVERLKRHERDAWEEVIVRYHSKIYIHIRGLGHDGATSEDLTQETFSQAYRRIGTLRDAHAFPRWLYRIATRKAIRQHQKMRRESGAIAQSIPSNPDDGVLSKLEGQEELQKLYKAINQLPPKLREAIILHDLEQLSIADSAIVAGVPEGTFKSRFHDARIVLKDVLAEGTRGER